MPPKKPKVVPVELSHEEWLAERKRVTSVRLPLIGQGWSTGVEIADPLERDHSCRRCPRSEHVTTVCMPALKTSEGKGGILVVMPSPTQADDSSQEVVLIGHTDIILSELRKHHKGNIRVTHAVACATPKPEEAEITACRPYLANEILTMRPDRILTVGDVAAFSVYGHKVQTFGMRKSWGFCLGIPVTSVMHPVSAVHNRFASVWLKEDIKWAVEYQPVPVEDGTVHVLSTVEEVQEFVSSIRQDQIVEFDCEWRGEIWKTNFYLLSAAFCVDPKAPVVIPGHLVITSKDILGPYLDNPRYRKVGHTAKIDRHALWRATGYDVRGITLDTLLLARMRESDSPAGLKSLAWNVGMGGYAGDLFEDEV